MTQHTPQNPKIKSSQKARKKIPKKITESYLHNSGLYYLERFASSKANFIDVMMRKVKKSCYVHVDQDFDVCAEMVLKTAEKFETLELLNDEVYARGKVRSLRLAGKSQRYIVGHLKQKGVSASLVQKHLTLYDEEHSAASEDSEWQALNVFARKKRIGPYRGTKETTAEKELGRLARAGFSYELSRRLLDETLEEL